MLRFYISVFCIALLLIFSPIDALAQNDNAPSIDSIPALKLFAEKAEGAHIEYVGRRYGIDMWIASKNGVVQILYTTLNGKGLITNNLLFGPNGNPVTEREISDYFATRPSVVEKIERDISKASERNPMSKSERFYADIFARATTLEFGAKNAPELISFVDPNCPHCREMWDQLSTAYIGSGRLKLTLIPVGFSGPESIAIAADIITAKDPLQAWITHHKDPIAASKNPSRDGVEKINKNNNIVQDWKINGTPFSLYRNVKGDIKVVTGIPEDIEAIITEMTTAETSTLNNKSKD